MISVVIPTLNAEERLGACLAALAPAAIDGLVKEAIVSDGGSADATTAIADAFGARVIEGPKGRGGQLARGAAAARGEHLLFLHADTVLDADWVEAAAPILAGEDRAGVFRLAFDAKGAAPRVVAAGAMVRTRLFVSPYGDQGLLIPRALYDELGGYADIPLFEDVDLIRRLVAARGRSALRVLGARAVTSAARYEKEGWARRVLRNAGLLARYYAGASPERLAERYGS